MKGSSRSSGLYIEKILCIYCAITHQLESSRLAAERGLQTEVQRENVDGTALTISKDAAALLAKAGRRPTTEKGVKIRLLMKS